MRVLDRPDHEVHIGEMLSSVRDAAERELYKYKQDAEEMFAKNVSSNNIHASNFSLELSKIFEMTPSFHPYSK